MTEPWLLRVTAPAADFAPLVAAARGLDLRVGWLELAPPEPPRALSAALEAGCAKAVEIGPGGSLAAKTRPGPPVLRDVLREHYRGTSLVLIRGEGGLALPPALATLEPTAEGFVLVSPDGTREPVAAEVVALRSRRKHPSAADGTA